MIINPVDFAREERSSSGQVTVAELARLADLLADRSGVVTWSLVGERSRVMGQGRRKFLNLTVQTELQVICQRCLSGLPFQVDVASRLELIEDGQPWPDEELEDDSCDAIEAPAEMDVLSLVEDEILLALPPVPRHDICAPPAFQGEESEKETVVVEAAKPSPFAVLAGLKRPES